MLAVLLLSQGAALLALALGVALGIELPAGGALAWSIGGSLAGLAGLAALYRGLAIGTMSIVAPVSAAGAIVPVAWGVLSGERPAGLQAVGIVVALVGVVLAARETDDSPGSHRASVGLGLLAAVGFGTFFVALGEATETAEPLGILAVARATAVPLLLIAALRVRPPRPQARLLPLLAAIGLLDAGANALFAVATEEGLLSVVSVLGSLYPAVTVILAHLVLHERIARVQQAGVVIALAGVALISAG